MKNCSECNKAHLISSLICEDCEEILEELLYLRFVWGTLIIAILVQILFSNLGQHGAGFIFEVLMNEAFFLITSYPVWKIIQKIKEPERKILQEMGSIFSERSDRIMMIVLLIMALFLSPKVFPALFSWEFKQGSIETIWYLTFWIIRTWVALLAMFFVPIAIMVDQGFRFFDMRIPNTYLGRDQRL